MLHFGYRIPWVRKPAHHRSAPYPQSPADLKFSSKTVDDWAHHAFVQELSPADAAAAKDVAPTFVAKGNSKDRLVVDLSRKNADMADRKFKYDSLARFTAQLQPNDNLISWDIQDAFFHVPLSPADQRRLAFRVGDRVFLPLVLPFGMKLSPYVFTKTMRPVVAALRHRGLRMIEYIDEFASTAPGPAPSSSAAATATRLWVLDFFASLGIAVHPTKGAVCGTTALPLLGFVVETERRLILLPPKRLDAIVSAAKALSSAANKNGRRVPFKALQRFTGKGVACTPAIPAARLNLRRLYAAQRGQMTHRYVRLCHGALRDLKWWRSLTTSRDVGRALWPASLGLLTTDASPWGWGGTWNNLVPAQGFFAAGYLPLHINVKEVAAVRLSIEAFYRHFPLSGGELDLLIDNKVAMHVINACSTRSPALAAELRQLYVLCRTLGLSIRASWIPSLANIWADKLSRDRDGTDWRLAAPLFRRLDSLFGVHEVDLFAASNNTHCARFYSFPASPGCDAINALDQSWAVGNLYANPPFSLIPLALNKIVADCATVTLILPIWQAQPWWAETVARANQAYLLPRSAGLFNPGRKQLPTPEPHWRAGAFRLVNGGKPWLPPRGGLTNEQPWPVPTPATVLPPLPSTACAT